jgi:hypothetical protein
VISYLPTDTHIPPAINQQAALAGVGAPIQAFRTTLSRILAIIGLIFLIVIIAWICYHIYAYFAFISLSQIYPHISDIPASQLEYYSWMQTLHDDFWNDLFKLANPLLIFLSFFLTFRVGFTTRIYLCTEGLLLIKKGTIQSIRWSQVKEVQTFNGSLRSLLSTNGTTFTFPKAFVYQKENRTIATCIIDEITRKELPNLLVQFDRGATISIGPLSANQTGIARIGVQLPWNDIGVSEIEERSLKIYGYQPKHAFSAKTLRWYKWANDTSSGVHDLPLFNALVNTILAREQSSAQYERMQQWKSMAATAKRVQKRRYWLIASGTIGLIVCLLAAFTFSLISYSNQQSQLADQRAARDLMLMQSNVKKLAQHPYYVSVPGAQCDPGQGNWIDSDDTNTYECLPNGLYMDQKNTAYEDAIYFNFDKGTDASSDSSLLFSGRYIPHHYQLQVKASVSSGGSGTCVAVHFHIQQFGGRQEFDICADNTWYYVYCDLQCNQEVQFANGTLPEKDSNPYLITVDVTDMLQTLYVDHTKIASIKDSGYSSTDEVALGVYGDTGTDPGAVFSDFQYTPFNQP